MVAISNRDAEMVVAILRHAHGLSRDCERRTGEDLRRYNALQRAAGIAARIEKKRFTQKQNKAL